MSVFRVWQITQFELTRLFATKRGLLALAAFAMVWFMILKYPIGHAVPFLNSPEFSDIAKQMAGSIGLRELVSWPEAEFSIYWIISLYCFRIFSLFISSDQTVGDRQRGTLRFLSLRSTRDEILVGRYLGQLLIMSILILATVVATLAVMTYRDHTLIGTGVLLGLKISVQLSIICMPFIALMAFINIIASSSRLSIIIAILLFTLGTGLISYISSYISIVDLLFYLFPGEQIADVAGQQDTNFFNWLLPVLQSLMWIILAGLILRKRAL
jgi:ABC-type transport system involved in multi-copper enzyme maturation permease subunit